MVVTLVPPPNVGVFVPQSSHMMRELLSKLGREVYSLDEADIVLFSGGSDISSSLYGEPETKYTKSNPLRDADEVSIFVRTVNRTKPIAYVGICRGGQLLNVLSGGSLWQHCHDHGSGHTIRDLATDKLYNVTSTHHQMMRAPLPTHKTRFSVLAVATKKDSPEVVVNTIKFGAKEADLSHDGMDIEAMWYPDTRSLCFQPHPEHFQSGDTQKLFLEYYHKLILPSLKPRLIN